MLRGIIGYESKKLFIRRNIIILAVIFILLAFFCWNGISDYKLITANKKPFQEIERNNVSRHIHYTAYGTRGVRLLYISSPLSVIFNRSSVFPGMTAHVDTGEKLEISNSFKGKDLFSYSGGFMDFSGIMLLISSFVALLYGWDATRKREYLKFISDISGSRKPGFLITLARIILLNLVFWVLSGLSLVWLFFNGINAANIFYLVYVLILTLVITFFTSAGALIGSFQYNVAQYITLPFFYFLLVFFIPWQILDGVYMETKENIQSIYYFENESFKYLMDFEKEFHKRFGVWKSGKPAPDDIKAMIESSQKSVYQKMRNLEDKRMASIVKRIRAYQTISALFPTAFYLSSNKELSSKGFQNFVNFYRYTYDMKFNFVDFYLDRKFYRPLPKSGVEPFIKGNEDLFYGQSHLPQGFILGLVLTIIYIAVLLVTLYRMQTKRIKEEKVKSVKVDFNKGNPLFALCKNEKIKSDIFRYYQEQKTAACINKITVDFHFNGVRADVVLKFLCQLAEVKEEKAIEYLSILGIKDLNTLKLKDEEILKFYAAVKIAGVEGVEGLELIVLNEFLKNESREMESDILSLLLFLEKSGKKILYLSTQIYQTMNNFDDRIEVDIFEVLPINLNKVSLR
jgi:hypothetical protein